MRPVVFFHIPKCGGQSLEKILGIDHPRHDREDSPHWRAKLGSAPLDVLKVVWYRHPLERLVSMHAWLSRLEQYPERAGNNAMMRAWGAMASVFTCDEFWHRFPWEIADQVTNFFRPVSWFIQRGDFDFIGRVESFSDDVERLSSLVGAELNSMKCNSSDHLSWSACLSKITIDRLMARYGKDFRIMGYER